MRDEATAVMYADAGHSSLNEFTLTPTPAVEQSRSEPTTQISEVEDPEESLLFTDSRYYAARFNGHILLDEKRDTLLTDFGRATMRDRYLLKGERYQEMFARVAVAYTDNLEHAQRIYDYISRLWFMPATPVLANGGADRGLPISCFLNTVGDSMEEIVGTWTENIWLAVKGGGIGTCWSKVRSKGELITDAGETSGIIPFVRVMDSLTIAISQGSLRRGSAAVYLDISHPEVEEFIEIRKPTGSDLNRKSLNLHHGLMISDEFMMAVKSDGYFSLKSPRDGRVIKKVYARELWQKILEIRLQTGEPYLVFSGNVAKHQPKHHRQLGLTVNQSNLCSEIMLPTGIDHLGNDRTAVCCLSSMNVETYSEWSHIAGQVIEDVMRFLDNVLQDFINRAPASMDRAKYAAMRERSVGLGIMGFHSFLQKNNIPFESGMAKSWNKRFAKLLRKHADEASQQLAKERGACPDAIDCGVMERFSHKLSIAPTASISIICGGTSASVEPIPANIYTHKTLSGSFSVKNQYLENLLDKHGINTKETWHSILEHEGSVQHLTQLPKEDREVFKTAFEIDQRWIIEFSNDRTPFICQASSTNLFIPADVDKWDLMMLHWEAWRGGSKSLYYLRSKSVQRASFVGGVDADNTLEKTRVSIGDSGVEIHNPGQTNYDECLACQ